MVSERRLGVLPLLDRRRLTPRFAGDVGPRPVNDDTLGHGWGLLSTSDEGQPGTAQSAKYIHAAIPRCGEFWETRIPTCVLGLPFR